MFCVLHYFTKGFAELTASLLKSYVRIDNWVSNFIKVNKGINFAVLMEATRFTSIIPSTWERRIKTDVYFLEVISVFEDQDMRF